MATTTNYGWTTPDDTALVKDGAAAIRTLGSSVDTTTKALNPSTTLGDIEYRSSTSNTNTRLGIGSTGNILTVAGGVPTWAAPAAGGGQTLLSTTSLSGASTTISSISSAYKHLYILIRNMYVGTGNPTVRIQLNGDTSSNYSYIWFRGDSSSTTGVGSSASATNAQIGDSSSSTTYSQVFNADINIPRYADADKKVFFANSNYYISNYYIQTNRAAWDSTAAINSITFSVSSSSFSGGTVYIYGVN
jgi:hypothetical protein